MRNRGERKRHKKDRKKMKREHMREKRGRRRERGEGVQRGGGDRGEEEPRKKRLK